MGSQRQNKKRRSSKSTIRQSNKPKKALNPRGNSIVAQNWNKKETLTQNYRRLGLTARLKAPTGGVEKSVRAAASGTRQPIPIDPFAIAPAVNKPTIGEARVERDADGKIIKIHYADAGRKPRANPLNDPLVALETDSEDDEDVDGGEWGGIEERDEESRPKVIRMLEEEASREVEKKPRHQSEQEVEWIERLVAKHGDNTAAMARDRKLNQMQQTERDIARRVNKWKQSQH
ncbi:Nop16-like protein [Verticillium alfalfae VaMs.102]|uniref:Nucleolar protein 16 n=1 Tax=Verticillium alfalfae (strain VaMs.102 / ATCC MYA-4576 / FGSC 10136) TaxID=526221 RepID=C9S955_VERA1|nr:Nop16-like protein [Verticillium alfalfae VaMs.102]EEY14103.1 Nop16-like protein [Verticillium alfalfae VaMs.102]